MIKKKKKVYILIGEGKTGSMQEKGGELMHTDRNVQKGRNKTGDTQPELGPIIMLHLNKPLIR